MIKEAYERGYCAIASGDSKSDNPYVKVTQGVEYYAWLGGFNDYDLGYDLDLSVF